MRRLSRNEIFTLRALVLACLGLNPLAGSILAGTHSEYIVTDLHDVFPVSNPTGLSPNGRVVGTWTNGGGASTQSFLWTPDSPNSAAGTLLDLGNFGNAGFSASDVNDSGQVSCTVSGNGYTWPYIWQTGTLTFLETDILPGGCHPYTGCGDPSFMYGGTFGINALGQVAGHFGFQGEQATFWGDPASGVTGSNFLSLAGGYSFAYQLNDAGVIVGRTNFFVSTGFGSAFLWDGSLHDLGRLDGTDDAYALDINDSNQVVGTSVSTNHGEHAFIYNWGQPLATMVDIHDGDNGNFGSTAAHGINNHGQVVGNRFNYGGNSYAFYWDSARGMLYLNSMVPAPWNALVITNAAKINDKRQIIAQTIDNRALLLTPNPLIFDDGFE
jgi:probable HAF family extracellular repeat protein